MRKKSVIELVGQRPHLFSNEVLSDLGIPLPVINNKKNHKARAAIWLSDEERFVCGEGWLPIIQSFSESLDQIAEITYLEVEGKAIASSNIEIDGVASRNNKLHIILRLGDISETDRQLVSLLQIFAGNMSSRICELCSSTVAYNLDYNHSGLARCRVCMFRQHS